MRRDFQVQAPEALATEDVGHWLTGDAARQVEVKEVMGLAADHTFRPGPQEAARFAQRGGEQQLGIQARAGRVRQMRLVEQGHDGCHGLSLSQSPAVSITERGQLVGLELLQ